MPTVHEKTWFSRVNIPLSSNRVQRNRDFIFELKNTLKGSFAGAPGDFPAWTVVGSSDGVTAGLDGVDRWTTTAKIVEPPAGATSAGARSWIVLQRGGIYMLIAGAYDQEYGSGPNSGWWAFSKTAPTGGLATGANETAVFPVMLPKCGSFSLAYSGMNFLGSALAYRLHLGVATDGSFCFAANEVGRGHFHALGFFNLFADARPADAAPFMFAKVQTSSAALRPGYVFHGGGLPVYLTGDADNSSGRFMINAAGTATEGCDLATLGGRMGTAQGTVRWGSAWLTSNDANEPVGSRPDFHLWVCGSNTLRGRLQDVRLAPENMADGTVDSVTDPKSFVAGCLWLPIAGAPDMS